MPSRFQPDKSIQLLDEACAYCATADPPAEVVSEASLMEALEDIIGHAAARAETITEQSVLAQLGALAARDSVDALGGGARSGSNRISVVGTARRLSSRGS